jgi:hypothetical protein
MWKYDFNMPQTMLTKLSHLLTGLTLNFLLPNDIKQGPWETGCIFLPCHPAFLIFYSALAYIFSFYKPLVTHAQQSMRQNQKSMSAFF